MGRARSTAIGATLVLAVACSGADDAGGTESAERRTPDGDVSGTAHVAATDLVLSQGDDPAADLYDQAVVHTFDLVLEPDDLAFLDADPAAEEYVDGFLDFGGVRHGPIGVRYKGSIGSFVGCLDAFQNDVPGGVKTCTKLSIKLKFDGDYDVDFFGVDKVQLHSQNLDPTMMHERLGYSMFRGFGVPAPRSTHAQVTMNGELLGLFALTEQIDEVFLSTAFDDPSGDLYKEIWPIDRFGEVPDEDELASGLRTNEDDPSSFEMMTDLAVAALRAPPGDRLQAIEPHVDVDSWLRYWVVDRAIRHDDGPFRFDCNDRWCRNKNFYLYAEPTADEIAIVAWDLDVAFATLTNDRSRTGQLVLEVADGWGEVTAGCEPFEFGPSALRQRSAACDPVIAAFTEDTDRYDELRVDFLGGLYSQASVDALLDGWTEQIEPFVAEAAANDPEALSVEDWLAEVAALRRDIAAERDR